MSAGKLLADILFVIAIDRAKNTRGRYYQSGVLTSFSLAGRDDWIRTSDPFVPNEVRYRAALHPALLFFQKAVAKVSVNKTQWKRDRILHFIAGFCRILSKFFRCQHVKMNRRPVL